MMMKKRAHLTGHNGAVYHLLAGLDDRYFYSAGGEGWIAKWEISSPDTGVLLARVDTQLYTTALDGENGWIIAGDMNGGIHWIDSTQERDTVDIAAHKKGIFSILVLEDKILTGGGDGRIKVWDRELHQSTESLLLGSSSVRSLARHPNGQLIVAGTSDNHLFFLTVGDYKVVHKIEDAHENSIFSAAFSQKGNYLYSGGRDAHLKQWDIEDNFNCKLSLPGHWYTINSIAVHPSKPILATASRDKTIRIWDSESLNLLQVIDKEKSNGHINSVNTIIWLGDNYLISGSDDRSIIIWEFDHLRDRPDQ